MHIHLPKPLHGWREFVGEVGIIVIGVLIALGAEQVIERLHWNHEVDAAREALRDDLSIVLVNARERQAEDICIRSRLGTLDALIAGSPSSLPAVGHIGAPAYRTWRLLSWPSAISSQIATHFPREEALRISQIQDSAVLIEQSSAREMDDWAELYVLVGPGRRIEPGEIAQARSALTDAAYRNNLLRLVSVQIDDMIVKTGLLSRADLRKVDADVRTVLAGANRRSLCGPIGAPAKHGVDAPYDPKVQPNPLENLTGVVSKPLAAQPRPATSL